MKKLTDLEMEVAKKGDGNIALKESDSAELMSYYLRAVRERSDFARLVRQQSQSNDFTSQLENVRTLIRERKYIEAKQIIDQCNPTTGEEQSELLLEKARFYYYNKDLEVARSILVSLTNAPNIIVTTKATSFELLGQIAVKLDDLDAAVEAFKRALGFLELLPFARSIFVAGAHLVKVLSLQKKLDEAFEIIKYLECKMNLFEQPDLRLGRQLLIMRAKVHYFRNLQNPSKVKDLLIECLHLARWLEDGEIADLCISELKNLGENLPASDLNNVYYLPLTQTLLSWRPKQVALFSAYPLLAKMLETLSTGPISNENFFERVWERTYSKDQDALHLRSALSKLRKRLPSDLISVRDGIIYFG